METLIDCRDGGRQGGGMSRKSLIVAGLLAVLLVVAWFVLRPQPPRLLTTVSHPPVLATATPR